MVRLELPKQASGSQSLVRKQVFLDREDDLKWVDILGTLELMEALAEAAGASKYVNYRDGTVIYRRKSDGQSKTPSVTLRRPRFSMLGESNPTPSCSQN